MLTFQGIHFHPICGEPLIRPTEVIFDCDIARILVVLILNVTGRTSNVM